MKQLKTTLTFCLLMTLFSCEPTVTFDEPQPTNTANLSKFPNRLQGEYISLADNSILSVGDKIIQRTYDYDYKFSMNQLDSNSRLSADTIINLKSGERTLIKKEGDSLINHIHYADTLFKLNYDNVVRKFKGYYFLNTRYNGESWEVKKVKIARGRLTIGSISTKSDLDNLKEITETSQDTVPPYKFTVTKKQFKKFIRNDGFSDSETFVKQ